MIEYEDEIKAKKTKKKKSEEIIRKIKTKFNLNKLIIKFYICFHFLAFAVLLFFFFKIPFFYSFLSLTISPPKKGKEKINSVLLLFCTLLHFTFSDVCARAHHLHLASISFCLKHTPKRNTNILLHYQNDDALK